MGNCYNSMKCTCIYEPVNRTKDKEQTLKSNSFMTQSVYLYIKLCIEEVDVRSVRKEQKAWYIFNSVKIVVMMRLFRLLQIELRARSML